jgi:hypothetical protein
MQITILKPRLDVSFKEGPVPDERGPIIPIREHWANFVKKLEHKHHLAGNQVRIIEKPLWQMTPDWVFRQAVEANTIYIPHRQGFEHPEVENVFFYMQTVFPEFFTIDSKGWGAHMSYIPMDVSNIEPNLELWGELEKRIYNNVSKFDQPNQIEINLENYWLFVCQIPHDQVIKQSSNISVIEALRCTLELAKKRGKFVVVKGHPVNPGAMIELAQLTVQYQNVAYVTDISIHSLLSKCEAAFMVNSGVGFEAMLHEVPIITFGNAEYKNVVNSFDGDNTALNSDVTLYQKFMTAFFDKLFYTGDIDGDFFESITNGAGLGRH